MAERETASRRRDRGEERHSDLTAGLLDDDEDRDELRRRYYGLLHENRVLLPGVQILVAFIVTVPFNSRFVDLDGPGRGLWAGALTFGCLAIIALLTPIVFHRVGGRRRRSARLVRAIRTQRLGIIAFAISLLLAVVVVARFVLGDEWAVGAFVVVSAMFVLCWIVVPLAGPDASERLPSPTGEPHLDT